MGEVLTPRKRARISRKLFSEYPSPHPKLRFSKEGRICALARLSLRVKHHFFSFQGGEARAGSGHLSQPRLAWRTHEDSLLMQWKLLVSVGRECPREAGSGRRKEVQRSPSGAKPNNAVRARVYFRFQVRRGHGAKEASSGTRRAEGGAEPSGTNKIR